MDAQKSTTSVSSAGVYYDTEHGDVNGTYIVNSKFATADDYNLAHLEKPDTNVVNQLKTTSDGITILIPQPSNDPDDPLNVRYLLQLI